MNENPEFNRKAVLEVSSAVLLFILPTTGLKKVEWVPLRTGFNACLNVLRTPRGNIVCITFGM
jgi:hypothetical protein